MTKEQNNMKHFYCYNCGKELDLTEKICPRCSFPVARIYQDGKNHIEDIEDQDIIDCYKTLNKKCNKSLNGTKSFSTTVFGQDLFISVEELGCKQYTRIIYAGARLYRSIIKENEHIILDIKSLDGLVHKSRKIWDTMTMAIVTEIAHEVPALANRPLEEIRDVSLAFLFSNGFESEYEYIISCIAQAINCANNNLNLENEYRSLRKDSRGRFGFIANSPKGIARGFFETSILNATTGVAHSAFNAVGSIKDQWKIETKKSKLLSQIRKDRLIQDALEKDLKAFEDCIWEYMRITCKQGNYEKKVDTWKNEAPGYLALYPYLDNTQDKQKCLVKGLLCNPSELKFYYFMFRDFSIQYKNDMDNVRRFAFKSGVDIERVENFVTNARSFNGIEYETFEECNHAVVEYAEIMSRTFQNVTYDTVEECNQAKAEYADIMSRTFQDVLYDTVEEKKAAETDYYKRCTYKHKTYSSPEEAQIAKEKDYEKDQIDKIVSCVNRNDRVSLKKTIEQLENLDLHYGLEKTELRKLKSRYRKISYEDYMTEFKIIFESIDKLTSEDTDKCLDLIDKAKERCTVDDEKVICQIVEKETSYNRNDLDNRFNTAVNNYNKAVHAFREKSKAHTPNFLAFLNVDLEDGYAVFGAWIATICCFLSSIYCLIHFFETIGTGYTLADGMFFGYLVVALFCLYKICDYNLSYFDAVDDCTLAYQFSFKKLNNLKTTIRDCEKSFAECKQEYANYNAIFEKVNKPLKLPVIPDPFSESNTFNEIYRKIDKESNIFKWVFTVVFTAIGIGIFIWLLCLILAHSPAKEKTNDSSSTQVATEQTNRDDSSKRIQLNKETLELGVGETYKLELNNHTGKVKWSINKKKIATVSKKGKVTARKKGKAIIKAKNKTKEYTCIITVK